MARRCRGACLGRTRRELGSAAAEFALVAGLLVMALVLVVQLALTLHVRVVLVDCAAAAARHGALAGNSAADAAERARDLTAAALPGLGPLDVSAELDEVDGLTVMAVRIDAAAPLLGSAVGARLRVIGHALAEDPQ